MYLLPTAARETGLGSFKQLWFRTVLSVVRILICCLSGILMQLHLAGVSGEVHGQEHSPLPGW